jgi:hypothetical protein
MSAIEQPVVEFFLALQRSVNAADAEAIARVFAAELFVATPADARAQTNDAAFRARIQRWLDTLRQAGIRDAKALQIDPAPLGATYALVQVRWSIWFAPEGQGDFVNEFLIDYLVAMRESGIEIVTVIVHDDEATLRQRMQVPG